MKYDIIQIDKDKFELRQESLMSKPERKIFAGPNSLITIKQNNEMRIYHDYLKSLDKYSVSDKLNNLLLDKFMSGIKQINDDEFKLVEVGECENPWDLNESDIIAAVQYGLKYSTDSQHNGIVPSGNILQWLMYRKGLLKVPTKFEIIADVI